MRPMARNRTAHAWGVEDITRREILGKRHTLLSLVLIAIIVLLVRLIFFLVYTPDVHHALPAPDSWLQIARNLVDGQGYSLTGPTAKRGPTVVFFFVAVLWLFGDGMWPIVIGQWLADVGTSILLFFIALEVFKSRRVAFISSLLFAFYGPGISYTIRAWSEPVFTLALAGFTLSLLRALRQPLSWRFALSGLLLGVATLARPSMQFYPLVLLPLIFWALDRRWSVALSSFAILFASFGLVLLPWAVRNSLIFHAFIPATSHSGRVLYQGNFALGDPDYLRYRNWKESEEALAKVLESRFGPAPGDTEGLNEHEIDKIAQQEGIRAIRAHPGRYVVLSLRRFFQLWFSQGFGIPPPLESYLTAITNGILLGLATAAFVFFRGTWLWPAIPLIVLVAFNTAVYIAVLAVPRFNIPIMPYVLVFAAQTIVRLGISTKLVPARA